MLESCLLMKTGQVGLSVAVLKTHTLVLNFQRIGVSSIIVKNQSKVTALKVAHEFRTSRSFVDGSRCAFSPPSRFRFGSSNMESLANVFNHWSLGDATQSNLFFRGGFFPKRCFSHSPKAVTKNSNVRETEGSKGNTPFKFFIRNWKRSRPLAAQSQKSAASPTVSVINDVTNASHEVLHDGVDIKDVDKVHISKVKQRPLGDKKKSKENQALPSASADGLPIDNSKSVSKGKRPGALKSGQVPLAPEKTITGNALEKVKNGSKARNNKSKKTESSSSQVKSAIEDHAHVQSDKACINTGKSESSQKQNPNFIVDTKNRGQRKLKHLYPPTGKSVVVVESVTKAKVIQGYLGDMYEVLPSYGHVKDLAARSGSVRPDDDFSMVWEFPSAAWTHLKSIKVALSGKSYSCV